MQTNPATAIKSDSIQASSAAVSALDLKNRLAGHAPLIIDVAGTSLLPIERERLLHPLVGGIILFTRNWQSRQQISDLCAEIKQLRSDLLIAIDHEGGRVQRFQTDGFTHLPAMAKLGALWPQEPALASQIATACGYVLASELRACSIDLSFTPVLDLDYAHSSVIGDRAFASNPETVTALAQALILGLLQAGMANCGKHFPGHGFVAADSHTSVPIDERPLNAILQDDIKPYAWLHNSLNSVMPAHVVYPQVDDKPAGFSQIWLQDILRQGLGFDGAIFSDDLSMEGARVVAGKTLSFTQAAHLALQAGCDMLLLCNQSIVQAGAAIDDLIAALSQSLIAGTWQASPDSARRHLALLANNTNATPQANWEDLGLDSRYRSSLELLKQL